MSRHEMRREAPATTKCTHPATRIYTWKAADGTFCVACCQCGAVLRGGAR